MQMMMLQKTKLLFLISCFGRLTLVSLRDMRDQSYAMTLEQLYMNIDSKYEIYKFAP
jgi:hypothetical protein